MLEIELILVRFGPHPAQALHIILSSTLALLSLLPCPIALDAPAVDRDRASSSCRTLVGLLSVIVCSVMLSSLRDGDLAPGMDLS